MSYGFNTNNANRLPDHTFDELRAGAVEVLRRPKPANSYEVLVEAIADHLAKAEGFTPQGIPGQFGGYPIKPQLSPNDLDLMLEVFGDLLRSGVIIYGLDHKNRGFDWFRVSRYGSGEKII